MPTTLKLVILVCSVIGFASASHLATSFVRERFIRAVDMTKIGTIVCLLVGSYSIFDPPSSVLQVWLRIFAPMATALAIAFLLAKRRLLRFEKELPNWLGILIMRMRLGYSLDAALDDEIKKNRTSSRFHMLAVARAVSFSQQNSYSMRSNDSLSSLPSQIRVVGEEFRRIHALPSRQIDEMVRWREQILAAEIFRRKSNQAMAQSRAQALVLGLIYLAIMIFTVVSFGWNSAKGAIQISLPMFFIGAFLVWRGGGRVKWTV